MLDMMEEVMAIADPGGIILDANEAMARRFGKTPEEFIGTCIWDFLPPELVEVRKQHLERVLRTREAVLFQDEREGRRFESALYPVLDENAEVLRVVLCARDTTDHKRLEEKLRESEARFRLIADYSNAAEIFRDEKGDLAYVSLGFQKIFGYTPEEYLTGRVRFEDFVHPRDQSRAAGFYERTCTPDQYSDLEFRIICRDGTERTVSVSSQPVFTGDGYFRGRRTSVRDITAHKRILDALQESEERYRALFSCESDAIMVHDLEGLRYVDVNDAAVRFYGYTREEFLQRTVADVSTDMEGARKAIETVKTRGTARVPLRWHRKKDGTLMPVEISAGYFEVRGKGFISTVNRDVSERLKTEELRVMYQNELEATVRERTVDLEKAKEVLLAELEERRAIEEQLLRHQRSLQSLASQLTLSEERERRRIASYLHDQIGHNLALAKHRLESLKKRNDPQDLERSLDDVLGLIKSCIQEVRGVTFDLSPPVLYELGLDAAVEWLAEKLLRENGIVAELEMEGSFQQMGSDVQVLLYQTVRELLVNVVKHSKASKVKIGLKRSKKEFNVRVEDNGIGMNARGRRGFPHFGGGFGLFTIRERVGSLGGAMDIKTRQGKGASIAVSVPLS